MNRLLCALLLPVMVFAAPQEAWLEAEAMAMPGGWVLDTQFIHVMGSPYLLAHGMGKPVADAQGQVTLKPGRHQVWVRTKNWVGPWQAPEPPGKFQVSVAGQRLEKVLGTEGADWLWQKAGEIEVQQEAKVPVQLHDLTGFDGRVDALYFTTDPAAKPPLEAKALAALRRGLLGLPEKAPESATYDLVVVGGGYSGLGAAISGARQGLKVALIQDRPVLGGNGSSEIQVWAQGGTRRGLYPHLGEIVEEFADRASNSPAADPAEFNDALKEQTVRAHANLDLHLNTSVHAVEMQQGKQIRAVVGLDTRSGRETRFVGRFFVDCTGHGTVGALAGAAFLMEEKGRMGMSNMWVLKRMAQPVSWPATPWALPLKIGDFPEPRAMEPVGKKNRANQEGFDLGYTPTPNMQEFLHGEWFWESGFDKHPINDLELIRDHNFRAVYGAVSALKTQEAQRYANYGMQWLAYIGGPRESRRIIGDLVLNGEDMVKGVIHPDGCVPTTWDQDLHYPKEQYAVKFPDNPCISRAEFGKHTDRRNGYPVPYRCFYSRDVGNLFMAGRTISVERHALGSTRVMRTCGMMGEVVGKAAWICVRHHTTPRGVYEQYLDILKDLMSKPGAMRRDSLEGELYLPANAKKLPEVASDSIDPKRLEGLVIDDEDAELTGTWSSGEGLKPFVGSHYRYSNQKDASARFAFAVKQGGKHEVRVFWQPHENRAKAAKISVTHAQGQTEMSLDQSKAASGDKGWHSLGVFTFNVGEEAAVTFRAGDSRGSVHIDAVQVLPKP